MPELPEVETMVRGIRGHVLGKTIRDLVECPNTCKSISIIPGFRRLKQRLISRQVTDVIRRGKRVVLVLDDDCHLVIEPRMTGLVLLADPPDVEHLRLEWQFDDGEKFWFWDRRGLGTVQLFDPGKFDSEVCSQKLGPDALEMTAAQWKSCCARTEREIKVLLLDQKAVAGIGNLYASEILHRAGIHPETPASQLKQSQLEQLADCVLAVLQKAIECEGSTLGDGTYRNALNQSGSYQNEHRVYMREGEPCLVCRTGTVLRIVQTQRSTFFCPKCQRPPRKPKKPGAKHRKAVR